MSSLFFSITTRPPTSTPFPYTTLFRSPAPRPSRSSDGGRHPPERARARPGRSGRCRRDRALSGGRSEEHTSELQSREKLVCRLLLEKEEEAMARRILGRLSVTLVLLAA